MNKNYLYVLPLALAMVAYSGQSIAEDQHSAVGADDKKVLKCEGDPQAPMITLNLEAETANPKCAFAHLGSTIVFSLVPKKGLDKIPVAITPKHPLDSWLQGDNSEHRDVIIIRVPGEHDPDNMKGESSTHKYNIVIGDKVVDPRIIVEY